MRKSLYGLIRDLHLYFGLFISPLVLVFAASVFVLVHPSGCRPARPAPAERVVSNLRIEEGLEKLSGRARIEAVRQVLEQAGVRGEIGFIRHLVREHRLAVPVSVPGRESEVDIDLSVRSATIFERETGVLESVVLLHKSPGPHLVDIRMNWLPMRIWRGMSDATVYLIFFISASGIYLWAVIRSERRPGIALLVAGAVSLAGLIYALIG
jgi:hypothetical protein